MRLYSESAMIETCMFRLQVVLILLVGGVTVQFRGVFNQFNMIMFFEFGSQFSLCLSLFFLLLES
jgi:hypothetical protein